ncbi:MAG TPA: hypothetical protein VKY90_15390 [Candidatus Dormibacteraeota bacterium]|nr:hypothetical protein [Candidatus Dormibacteraeota bacterium]
MDEQPSERDLIELLRAEVGAWRPRDVPTLVEVVGRAEGHWRRPVALASVLGAAVLAIALVVSVLLLAVSPAIPGGETIRAHLIGP